MGALGFELRLNIVSRLFRHISVLRGVRLAQGEVKSAHLFHDTEPLADLIIDRCKLGFADLQLGLGVLFRDLIPVMHYENTDELS